MTIVMLFRQSLMETYHLLDPTAPKVGRYQSRWRLSANLSEDELRGPHKEPKTCYQPIGAPWLSSP
jgi:predicted transcriptional regulator of viral defense system